MVKVSLVENTPMWKASLCLRSPLLKMLPSGSFVVVKVSLVETAPKWKASLWLRSPLLKMLPSGKHRCGYGLPC